MSHEISQRGDLYAFVGDGVKPESPDIGPLKRIYKLDRCHVFTDERGREILPANLLRAKGNRKIDKFRGKTMKLGTAHSHDGNHRHHILEDVQKRPRDLLIRFRKAARDFRRVRKENRDR